MSVVDQLHEALFAGIQDGRATSRREAPTFAQVAGLKSPNYAALDKPVYVTPMPHPILGATGIRPDGEVSYIAVNSRIPLWAERMRQKYNEGVQWAKNLVYKIARNTQEHEDYHAISSRVAKGEKPSRYLTDVMETLTTYARAKVAEILGNFKKAKMVEATNPYAAAWRLGKLADWAPYEGLSGTGYAAFIMDVQSEPFRKTLWRLAKSATKAAVKKGRDYIRGTAVPEYVPQSAAA